MLCQGGDLARAFYVKNIHSAEASLLRKLMHGLARQVPQSTCGSRRDAAQSSSSSDYVRAADSCFRVHDPVQRTCHASAYEGGTLGREPFHDCRKYSEGEEAQGCAEVAGMVCVVEQGVAKASGTKALVLQRHTASVALSRIACGAWKEEEAMCVGDRDLLSCH